MLTMSNIQAQNELNYYQFNNYTEGICEINTWSLVKPFGHQTCFESGNGFFQVLLNSKDLLIPYDILYGLRWYKDPYDIIK